MSPDGQTLATGSTDGAVRLPQVTPDGAHLFAIFAAGRGYRWDVRPASRTRYACAVAGRPLTRAEWADALPERPFSPACAR